MKEMTDQCCSAPVEPDFDMIKQLMEHRGNSEFSDTALQMLKEFCIQDRKPDMARMKQMTESRRCQRPESAPRKEVIKQLQLAYEGDQ
ncbi:MAG: hypothetical protein IH912_08940 [Proteobacteria bacterium]|nr:hypothetical protein [Pseudomonadota bacterium]